MGTSPIITSPGQTTFDSGGAFIPGTQALLFFTFTDLRGQLYDPYDMEIEIVDSSDTVVETGDALDKVELGVFAYVWNIARDQTPGPYRAMLTYTVETIDGSVTSTFQQNLVVAESGSTQAYTFRQTACRAFLETMIGYLQRIPVFHEIARFNKSNTTGELSFGRWNQSAGAQVFVNGQPRNEGFEIDYLRGRILFSSALSEYDEVTCSYNFRWFSDDEMDGFIEQGVNVVNIWPPQSVYTINSIPDAWIITAEYAAAIHVLRRWMMDIQFQEPIKIFGSFERAQQVFGNLDTLKKNFEDQLDKMLEQKKYGPYAGLTKTITVPEYTLPGGRSRWFRYLFKGA
jgi:hypothetical protein